MLKAPQYNYIQLFCLFLLLFFLDDLPETFHLVKEWHLKSRTKGLKIAIATEGT